MNTSDNAELIDQLRRENRRWKRLATVLMGILCLIVGICVVGGFVSISAMRAEAMRAREAELVARMAAEQALEAAVKERDRARQAELDAR